MGEYGACVVAIPEPVPGLPAEVEGGIHVTLGYFGDEELEGDLARELLRIVRDMARETDSFSATTRSLEFFGKEKDAHVLTLDDSKSSPFVDLRETMLESMSEGLREAFDAAETFPKYRPHMTLGYLSEGYEPSGKRPPREIRIRALAFWNGENRKTFRLDERKTDRRKKMGYDKAMFRRILLAGLEYKADHPELEEKARLKAGLKPRRVASQAGVRRYDQPLGSIILPGVPGLPFDISTRKRISRTPSGSTAKIPEVPSIPIPARGNSGVGPNRRAKPKVAVDGGAAPRQARNAGPRKNPENPVLPSARLNKRDQERGFIRGKANGMHPESATEEEMWRKIENDGRGLRIKGNVQMRRVWATQNPQIAEQTRNRIAAKWGETWAEQFWREWEDPTKGHVVVPEDFDSYPGDDVYLVQEAKGTWKPGDPHNKAMKWQPKVRNAVKLSNARGKFQRRRQEVADYKNLLSSVERDKFSDDPVTQRNASVAYFVAATGFRIGSEAKDVNDKVGVGATQMRVEHITRLDPRAGVVEFKFIPGKTKVSGETGQKEPVTVRMTGAHDFARFLGLWTVNKDPDAYIFANKDGSSVSDKPVNEYIREKTNGSLTSRNLRTFLATALAVEEIQNYQQTNPAPPKNAKEMGDRIKMLAQRSASQVGHTTPTTTINSYIDPAVWLQIGPLEFMPKDLQTILGRDN